MRPIEHSELLPRIRPLQLADEPVLAAIITRGIVEFCGTDIATTRAGDPELQDLYRAYTASRDRYLVVEDSGRPVGGGGFRAIDATVAELRKMYLQPTHRGRGLGRRLLQELLTLATDLGYTTIELATRSEMTAARHLYDSIGFVEVPASNTTCGQATCDRRYRLSLTDR